MGYMEKLVMHIDACICTGIMELMRTITFRNNILRLRREKNFRQLDLARKLDIYQSEVSSIERGEREPGVHLAKRIAKVFGRSVDEVF